MSSGEVSQEGAAEEARADAATLRWEEIAPGLAIPEAFSYTAPPGNGPAARLHLRVTDREVVCERLEIAPRSADEPLTAQRIRDVPFGALMQQAPAVAARAITFDDSHPDRIEEEEIRVRPLTEQAAIVLAWFLEDPAEPTKGALKDSWQSMSSAELVDAVTSLPSPRPRDLSDDERAVAEGATAPRRRRPPPTDEELREMAEDYRAFRRLKRTDPTIQVAKKHHMSRSTASRRLRRARDLGYL